MERWREDPVEFYNDCFGFKAWKRQREVLRSVRDHKRTAVRSGHKVSKALDVATPVATADGWSTMGDLMAGDRVFDERGRACTVTGTSDTFVGRKCFEVLFDDGSSIVADADHLWSSSASSAELEPTQRTTVELRDTLMSGRTPTIAGGLRATERRKVVFVTPVPSRPVRCIAVDSESHLFLAGRSMVPTHNSNTAAAVGIWWGVTRPEGRVITTATTSRQIRNIIWREVRAMHRRAMKVGEVWFPRPAVQPGNGIQWPDGREFIGQTAEDTEAMSGLSGPDMLFIIDEASGVHPDIFVAIRGNMAGGASLLLISNPSKPTGDFHAAFHEHRELYNCIHIRSDESPNISYVDDFEVRGVPEEDRIPGLAMPDYVRESRIEYGPDWKRSPLYHIRVLGNFPQQSEMCVIGAGVVLAAVAGFEFAEWEGQLNIGVDVAHFGDDETSMILLRGNKALPAETVNGFSEQRSACMVADAVRANWKFGELDVLVKVDTGGGYGTELVGRLLDADDKCWSHNWVQCEDGSHVWEKRREVNPWGAEPPPVQVFEVNGSCASTVLSPTTDLPEFTNLRSQIWFGIETWMKAGGTIGDDKKLQAELVAPTYFLRSNRRAVESKVEIKKRLKRSPDRGDSLGLAIYQPEDQVVTGSAPTDEHTEWKEERGYG